MVNKLLACVSLALLASIAAITSLRAEDHLSGFKSVKAELPFGDRMFPEGPNSDVISNNCLACHSAGMILNQPSLSRATWQAEVEKMRTTFKAPIDEAEVKPIVDYLVEIKGD